MQVYSSVIVPTKPAFDEVKEALTTIAPERFLLLVEKFDKEKLRDVFHVVWSSGTNAVGTLHRMLKNAITKEGVENIDDKITYKTIRVENLLDCYLYILKNTSRYHVLFKRDDIEDAFIIDKNKLGEYTVLPLEEASRYIMHYAKQYNIQIDLEKVDNYIRYILAHMIFHHNFCITHLYPHIDSIVNDIKIMSKKTPPRKGDFGI